MNIWFRRTLLALVCCCWPISVYAADGVDAAAASIAHSAAVDRLFAKINERGGAGMAVGVYRSGRAVHLRGYGLADLEQGTPITPQTVFHVASVSKQFTAFAIALLAREGKVDLDADIRKYLPYVPDFGRPITVRHLVHHTSGLRDQWSLFELGGQDYRGVLLQQQVVSMVARQRGLNFEPGSEYDYNNTGYTLLAEIVSKASGRTFREFVDQRVLRPLGMTRSLVYDDFTELVPGRAHSYVEATDAPPGSPRWRRALLNMQTYGATSLFTTVEDLMKWAGNFTHPTVGNAALISQVSAPGALDDGTPINYGFGLRRDEFAGHEAVGHTGSDAAFSTIFVVFPKEDFAVSILSNHAAGLYGYVDAIAGIYLNEGRVTKRSTSQLASVQPKPGLVQALAGQYLAEHGALVTLRAKGESLEWNSLAPWDDRPGQPLTFRADGSFDLGERQRKLAHYKAHRASDGRVMAFEEIATSGGRTIRYERVQQARPTSAGLTKVAGDYYSDELDITYTFAVEDGKLVARSLWTEAPIVFTPSVEDRFDSNDSRLPTIVVERDADGEPVAMRIAGAYMRNVLLQRKAAAPVQALPVPVAMPSSGSR